MKKSADKPQTTAANTNRKQPSQSGTAFTDNRAAQFSQNKINNVINNSTRAKQLKSLDEKINTSNTSNTGIIQCVLDGSELSRTLIGKKAEEYGLHQWGDGEFVSSEESDTNTFEVHVHNYGVDSEDDDTAELTGHAVWKKKFGTSNRNQQALTVSAERHEGGRWNATLEKGDERVDLPDSSATDGKTSLYSDVVDELDSIVKDALNED